MKDRALVLSGGGAKGAFQIGILEDLLLGRGLDFRVLCGVSVGNLAAAFLAQAPYIAEDPKASARRLAETFEALRAIWLERIRGDGSIYRESFLSLPRAALGADGLLDPAPLRRLIRGMIRRDALLASGRVLRIGLVSLLDGRFRAVTNHPTGADDEIAIADLSERELRDAILASTAIPFMFPPVWLRGHLCVDGGVRDITPLSHAFRENPSEIFAVFSAPGGRTVPQKPARTYRDGPLGMRVSAFTMLVRSIEILTDEIYVEDIGGARLWNEVVGAWDGLAGVLPDEVRGSEPYRRLDAIVGRKRKADLFEFYPETFYGESNEATDFDPRSIRAYYEHGLAIARAHPRGNGPATPPAP
ncbi:MAG: patatin-like phospholipase family protein [Planctomycetes bacterium]|nr:patatin-like phospholipase family protein [Planctomycetota bacterium]